MAVIVYLFIYVLLCTYRFVVEVIFNFVIWQTHNFGKGRGAEFGAGPRCLHLLHLPSGVACCIRPFPKYLHLGIRCH